jgi:hypothetical protein
MVYLIPVNVGNNSNNNNGIGYTGISNKINYCEAVVWIKIRLSSSSGAVPTIRLY